MKRVTMKFPCSGCGACCRRIGWLPENELIKHGLKANEQGACVNLLPDNSCDIYESRPDICRVDVQAKESDEDVKDYYESNIQLCNKWMDEDGMSNLKIQL